MLEIFTAEGRLKAVQRSIERSLTMFTRMLEKLKLNNEKLNGVTSECEEVINAHTKIKTDAEKQIERNNKLIININKIVK